MHFNKKLATRRNQKVIHPRCVLLAVFHVAFSLPFLSTFRTSSHKFHLEDTCLKICETLFENWKLILTFYYFLRR